MKRLALLSVSLLPLFTSNASALEFELKQKIKSRSSVFVSDIKKSDAGKVKKQKDKRKEKAVYQSRFVVHFDPIIGNLKPYIQVGYEREKQQVDQFTTTPEKQYNQSYNEFMTAQFFGVGAKYKVKNLAFSEKAKFEVRYDRWQSVDIERSQLANDASPLTGSFTGYERKLKIEALYATPWANLKIQPHMYYKFEKQKAWVNELKSNDTQNKEKKHKVEARMLLTWLPEKIENLELSLGPEVVTEKSYEFEPSNGWVSEKDDVTLVTFWGTYELSKYNLEFELWLQRQLDGELQGENNLEFKVDWNF